MKHLLRIVAVGLSAHLAACARTVPVTFTSVERSSVLRHIDQEGDDRRSTVRTDRGTISANRLEVGPSALLIHTVSGESIAVPGQDVREIDFRYGGAGALDGMAIGGLAAASVGLVAALLIDPGSDSIGRTGVGLVVSILTAAATVPVGALIGYGVGRHVHYDFTETSVDRQGR